MKATTPLGSSPQPPQRTIEAIALVCILVMIAYITWVNTAFGAPDTGVHGGHHDGHYSNHCPGIAPTCHVAESPYCLCTGAEWSTCYWVCVHS